MPSWWRESLGFQKNLEEKLRARTSPEKSWICCRNRGRLTCLVFFPLFDPIFPKLHDLILKSFSPEPGEQCDLNMGTIARCRGSNKFSKNDILYNSGHPFLILLIKTSLLISSNSSHSICWHKACFSYHNNRSEERIWPWLMNLLSLTYLSSGCLF